MANTSQSNDLEQALSRTQITDEIDIINLVTVLWRGKIWIALCGLFGLVFGIYHAYFSAVPIYTAKATVVMENRQDQVVDLGTVVSGLPSDQTSINTEVQVFTSRRLLEKLVNELDLTNDPEFNARLRAEPAFSLRKTLSVAINKIQGNTLRTSTVSPDAIFESVTNSVSGRISVSNIRQSYAFVISARSQQREKSALLANTLAELYIEDQIEVKFERTQQATEWLTGQVTDLQVELENSEAALKSFSSNTDLISPEGLVALNRQLKDLRDRQSDLISRIDTATMRLNALKAAKATNDPIQMAAAAGSTALERQAARLENASADEGFNNDFARIISRVEIERGRAESQLNAIRTSISQLGQQIQTQTTELVRLQQLQREAEATRIIYEYFLTRLKETSVQQGIQQADSRIISKAVKPGGPSSPRRKLILMTSLLIGLGAGALLILLREFSQNTFRVAEDLEKKTGYPVLGQIPIIPSRSRKKVLQYLKDKPNSAAAEAVRSLRTSLLLANLDNHPQVIMSTSSVPGEGKTTQSIALAQNLSGLGKKVLLIEGDIRRRVFGEYFNIDTEGGLLSVLLGEQPLEEALGRLPDMDIDILLGERSSTNAADIFSSERFSRFIDGLREKYDYIIIDTPPVLAVTDARIIARWVDATIYTVKWDSTTHRQVTDGLKTLEQVNVQVSGLVLGQISAKGMKRYGYGDSYGAYQAYYNT